MSSGKVDIDFELKNRNDRKMDSVDELERKKQRIVTVNTNFC